MKLIHGDSHVELEKIKLESVDAIIIDPPYRYFKKEKKFRLDKSFNREKIFNELYRILKNNSFICIFGRGIELCKDVIYLQELGFFFLEEIVWHKNRNSNMFGELLRFHELCYILVKGNRKLNKVKLDYFETIANEERLDKLKADYNRIKHSLNNANINDLKKYLEIGVVNYNKIYNSNHKIISGLKKIGEAGINTAKKIKEGTMIRSVIKCNIEQNKYKVPTQKPVELLKRLILLTTKEGDLILDCFMGSASCGKAALDLNRDFIGIEIDDEYFEIAKENIEEKQKELKEKLDLKD